MLHLGSLRLSFRTQSLPQKILGFALVTFFGTCRASESLYGEKGKRPRSPDTDLRLCSMEGDEGGGESTRGGAFCFGAENSLMSSLLRGDSSSQEQRGFGLNQAWRGPNQFVVPGYFPQSGSHFSSTFPMRTDFFGAEPASISKTCHGFPYDNISIPNSTTSNLNGPVGCSDFVSSSSNSFALQMASFHPSMANSFYFASASPCNSMAPPTTSQHALLPVSDSSVNFINNEHWDVEGARNQEGLKDTDLKLILQKELSNSDVGTVGRIVLPKKEAESNLPPLTEREGIILKMDDLELPVTWKFKYRFWPNNRSRMYVMETTGDFVKAHGLQAGDHIIIYRSLTSENYVVRGMKGVRPPTHIVALHDDCTNECCMLPGYCNQQLFDKHERVDSRKLWLEDSRKLWLELGKKLGTHQQ